MKKPKPQIKTYWLSTSKVTGLVEVINESISKTPPIWKRFIGQHIWNLIRWLKSVDSGLIIEERLVEKGNFLVKNGKNGSIKEKGKF